MDIERGLRDAGGGVEPPSDWQENVHRRLARRRRCIVVLWLGSFASLCVLAVFTTGYVYDQLHPAPVVVGRPVYIDQPRFLTALAVLLECSGKRQVLTWGGGHRDVEMFALQDRPKRGEMWLVLVESGASADPVAYEEWRRRPWETPHGWGGRIEKRFHLTIGAGCVLGDRIDEENSP